MEMRKREEIEKAAKGSTPFSNERYDRITLEVLLDIRDLLQDLSERYC